MNEELKLLIESEHFHALIEYLDKERQLSVEYLITTDSPMEVQKLQEKIKFIDELKGYFNYVRPAT